jgi:hypothetical protein
MSRSTSSIDRMIDQPASAPGSCPDRAATTL